VIKSFRHKGLKKLFETGDRRGVTTDLAGRLRRQLDVLNRARTTADVNLPGYRLHQLKGDRLGTWSVTVNGNWRLTLTFDGEDASDVDLEDYH
jgi:proteic killer suppression protein